MGRFSALAVTLAVALCFVTGCGASRAERSLRSAQDGRGVSVYRTWRTFGVGHGLPSASIRAILVEGDEVWVGTDLGLARREGEAWRSWTAADGLPRAPVSAIDIDASTGELWLGTLGGGAVRFSGGRFDIFDQINSGLAGDQIFDLKVWRGRVWIATNAGVSAFDPIADTWELYLERRGDEPQIVVVSLAVISPEAARAGDEGALYAASWCGPLLRYQGERDKWIAVEVPYAPRLPEATRDRAALTTSTAVAASGTVLWWATQSELVRFDGPGGGEPYSPLASQARTRGSSRAGRLYGLDHVGDRHGGVRHDDVRHEGIRHGSVGHGRVGHGRVGWGSAGYGRVGQGSVRRGSAGCGSVGQDSVRRGSAGRGSAGRGSAGHGSISNGGLGLGGVRLDAVRDYDVGQSGAPHGRAVDGLAPQAGVDYGVSTYGGVPEEGVGPGGGWLKHSIRLPRSPAGTDSSSPLRAGPFITHVAARGACEVWLGSREGVHLLAEGSPDRWLTYRSGADGKDGTAVLSRAGRIAGERHLESAPADDRVRCIALGPDSVWIGTPNGLSVGSEPVAWDSLPPGVRSPGADRSAVSKAKIRDAEKPSAPSPSDSTRTAEASARSGAQTRDADEPSAELPTDITRTAEKPAGSRRGMRHADEPPAPSTSDTTRPPEQAAGSRRGMRHADEPPAPSTSEASRPPEQTAGSRRGMRHADEPPAPSTSDTTRPPEQTAGSRRRMGDADEPSAPSPSGSTRTAEETAKSRDGSRGADDPASLLPPELPGPAEYAATSRAVRATAQEPAGASEATQPTRSGAGPEATTFPSTLAPQRVAIGLLAPLNKPIAIPGADDPWPDMQVDRLAVEEAIRQVNEKGGHRGRTIIELAGTPLQFERYGWGTPEDTAALLALRPEVAGLVGIIGFTGLETMGNVEAIGPSAAATEPRHTHGSDASGDPAPSAGAGPAPQSDRDPGPNSGSGRESEPGRGPWTGSAAGRGPGSSRSPGSDPASTPSVESALVARLELPVVNAAPTEPAIDEIINPWIFRCDCLGDERQARLLDPFIKRTRYPRIAIVRTPGDEARRRAEFWARRAEERGGGLALQVDWNPEVEDLGAVIRLLREARPEIVLTWADPRTSASLLMGMRDRGLTAVFVGSDRIVTDEFTKLIGEDPGPLLAVAPCAHGVAAAPWRPLAAGPAPLSHAASAGSEEQDRSPALRPAEGNQRSSGNSGDPESAWETQSIYDRSFLAAAHLLAAIERAGTDREAVRRALEAMNLEAVARWERGAWRIGPAAKILIDLARPHRK